MDSKHFKRYSTLLVIKNESCLQVETKMRYHLTAVWMAINRNVVQVVQKIKPCALLVGNANWCSCYEIQYGSSSKMVKIELPHDPAFPHLTIHWKKKKTISESNLQDSLGGPVFKAWCCHSRLNMCSIPGQRRSTCSVVQGEKISMYPNVESGIFKINNTRYGHKFTTDELINMSWYIQVEYCSAVKENMILAIETTWISLEVIMLKEINQTHKNKYYIWYCFSEELKTRTN